MIKIIYLLSAVSLTLLLVSFGTEAVEIMRWKHPSWTPKKTSIAETIYSIATLLFSILCPIWNTILVIIFIGNKDEMIEKAIKNLEEKHNLKD